MSSAYWKLALALAGLGSLAACHHHHHRDAEVRVGVYEQPAPPPQQVVVVQEAPPPQEQVIIVREAPPPPYAEAIPPRPGREFVWVGGYWVRHRDRWVWVGGHWVRPPHPGAVYVEPRWERHGGEFHFSVGVWR